MEERGRFALAGWPESQELSEKGGGGYGVGASPKAGTSKTFYRKRLKQAALQVR